MSTEADGFAEPDGDVRGPLGEALAGMERVTRWRKKPVVMEAHQWFRNGDHPDDNCYLVKPHPASLTQFAPFMSEGEVVRYFRHPDIPGDQACSKCGRLMHDHGWIDTLEDGHNVCPGDWIVTGIQGERWPVKPDVFAATYEPADSADPVAAERERIASGIRDEADHLEVHVSPDPEASRNFVAGMRRAADYAVNGPNPPMANET